MTTSKFLSTFTILLISFSFSFAYNAKKQVKADTLIVNLLDNNSVKIYYSDTAELAQLLEYDWNNIFKDMYERNKKDTVIRDYRNLLILNDSAHVSENDSILIFDDPFKDEKIDMNAKTLIDLGKFEFEMDMNNPSAGNTEINKYYIEKTEEKKNRQFFNVDVGFNNWINTNSNEAYENSSLYSVKPWGSWYVGLGFKNRSHIKGGFSLEWGVDISWYNWKLENKNVKITKDDQGVLFNPLEVPNITFLKSKLRATYLNASLIPMFDFGRKHKKVIELSSQGFKFKVYRKTGFRLGAGMYVGYRLESKAKQTYKEDKEKKKFKEGGKFFINDLRYGVRVQLGFNAIDVFFAYDLNNVFENNKGPKLNAYTIGINL